MAREFEHAEDAEDSQGDKRSAEVFVVGDTESNVVGQDCDHIYDAHGAGHVVAATRSRVQTQQVLGRENADAGRVQTEEFDAEPLSASDAESAAPVLAARYRLYNVGQYRDSYEERSSDPKSEVIRPKMA